MNELHKRFKIKTTTVKPTEVFPKLLEKAKTIKIEDVTTETFSGEFTFTYHVEMELDITHFAVELSKKV